MTQKTYRPTPVQLKTVVIPRQLSAINVRQNKTAYTPPRPVVRPPVAGPQTLHIAQLKPLPKPPAPYCPAPVPRCQQVTRQTVQPSLVNKPSVVVANQRMPTQVVTRPTPSRQAASAFVERQLVSPRITQPAHRNKLIQPTVSPSQIGVVQTTKFFPNLHPGAALPVNRSNVFKLDSVTDQYRLRRLNSHFVSVPNQRYNFVTTTKGELLLHNRYRHPSLAEGHQVLYAGEVAFNNGRLDWWSNASGHYQPDSDHAKQAALPLDQFYTYQQVLKGEHKKKNVLTNKKQGEE